MSAVLSATRVNQIFSDCLLKEDEGKEGLVTVEGIVRPKVVLHRSRLEAHREEITQMLLELPDDFMSRGGKGMSFLNACKDRHGNQWTGVHRTMESLFILGIGIGKARYILPRFAWAALPGAVPYIVVNNDPAT